MPVPAKTGVRAPDEAAQLGLERPHPFIFFERSALANAPTTKAVDVLFLIGWQRGRAGNEEEQRAGWPHYRSDRRGEGATDPITIGAGFVRLSFFADFC